MSEVRRLEETANKNEEELSVIMEDRGANNGGVIRGELDQLKHRLGKNKGRFKKKMEFPIKGQTYWSCIYLLLCHVNTGKAPNIVDAERSSRVRMSQVSQLKMSVDVELELIIFYCKGTGVSC